MGALATWRIARLLIHDDIMRPLRRWLGQDENDSWPDTAWGTLWSCMDCLSFWVAVGVVGILHIAPVLLIPFAFGAVSIFMERKHGY